jgi:hypothetical protein
LLTLEISSSKIDMGEGISIGYEVLGISVRSASGMGGKNQNFRASAFSEGAIAIMEAVARLGMVGGEGEELLLPFAQFASGQIHLLPLAALATACLSCTALAFLMAHPLALSAFR